MKKNKRRNLFILLSAIFLLIIIGGFISIKIKINHLNEKIEWADSFPACGVIGGCLTMYYDDYNHFPDSLEQLIPWGHWDKFYENHIKKMMKDPYSKSGQNLIYIPIYDRNSNHQVSFIILSAGEDRKINNHIGNRRLYMDNWFDKIKLYNNDLAKIAKQKVAVRYPIFYNNQVVRHVEIIINKSDLNTGKLKLEGDTILYNSEYYKDFRYRNNGLTVDQPISNASIMRILFGNKDYLVSYGPEIINYKMSAKSLKHNKIKQGQ